MRRCSQCGASSRAGARFCGQCGGPLGTPPAASSGPGATPARSDVHAAAAVPTARPLLGGERRRITALWADMGTSTELTDRCDPEDAHRIMNDCFALVTDAVQRLGGTVSQYTSDGVMALFGASRALEDGPRRAVQAALDIQRALRDYSRALEAERGLGVRVRIGLHTGLVMVGRSGDDLRMDYTAMGDTTTVAARLQAEASPGSVLISGATRNLVADHFELADLGELPGHTAPLHAFEVLRALPRRARLQTGGERGLTPYSGRERELSALLELFTTAKSGHGQVVFITGETGIGKSRLVHELRRRLVLGGEEATWLEGRCMSFGRAIPLLPVRDQLDESFDIEESDSDDDVVGKIDAGLARLGEPAAQAPFLRSVLAGEPGSSERQVVAAAVRRARTFDALRAVSRRLAQRRPVVLVFEDLQWIDSSSEEYLAALIDTVAGAPMLVIGTHRLDYVPPFGDYSHCTTVMLRPLAEADIVAMAGRALATAHCPPEVAAVLLAKTRGVPLLVEETIRALLDLGVLRRHDDGQCVVTGIADVDLPDTIEGILRARLDRLDESAKRTAQLAAVIGCTFAKRLLERVAERPHELDGLLAELERTGIVCTEGRLPEGAYAFTHATVRDVAYDSLAPQRRRDLHRVVGLALEERYAERRARHCGELAHHFARAEHWAKALQYADLAGDGAAYVYANREAKDQYGCAIDAAERLRPAVEPGVLAALHGKRGAVLKALGEHDEGIAHYERALALVRAAGDRRAEIEMCLGLAGLYYAAHRPDGAQTHCAQAEELADALGDARARLTCLARRAEYIAAWHGPIADARRAARAALEVAESVEVPVLRARTLVTLGALLQWRADLEACLRCLQEGAALAQQAESAATLGHALFHLGHAHLARGRYEQALRWYGELHRHAGGGNDAFWLARLPNLVGGVHLELYDLDAAIRLCHEGDEVAQRLSASPAPRAHCLVKLGLAHLQRGEHGAADEFLRRAETLLERDAWARWRWHVPLLRARSELALAGGRLDDAWRDATQSLELATQTDSRKHVAHAKLLLGEIAAAQDRLPEAEKLLRGAVTLADHLHAARQLWLAGSALGQTLARMGRERDAETYLTQAAQTIEAIAGELADPGLRASFIRAAPVAEVYRRLGRRAIA